MRSVATGETQGRRESRRRLSVSMARLIRRRKLRSASFAFNASKRTRSWHL